MRARVALAMVCLHAFAHVARAATLEEFGRVGAYETSSVTLGVPAGGAGEEAGEIVLDYPIGAGDQGPLVVFCFPIHGFPFTAWRRLLAPVVQALVTNGFAVASPSVVGSGARQIRGGLFPGTESTASGMDLREIATRYLNFMTHGTRYLVDLVENDASFEASDIVSTARIGIVGFSVGGAMAQYLSQTVDKMLPGRVSAVVALAPTIGSEAPLSGDDIGAQLFQTYSISQVPTFYVAGENDGMGGLRDSALYYTRSNAPRVRIIAGNGATHCHAIVPMSECDILAGTRGLHALDAVVTHAAMTYYLLPDTSYWREKRAHALDILWRDGLRELASGLPVTTPLGSRWDVASIERVPEISLALNQYSITAPLAPSSLELVAIVTSSLFDECEDVDVFIVDAPVGIQANARRVNKREFAVDVSWTTVPPRPRPSLLDRAFGRRRLLWGRSPWGSAGSASAFPGAGLPGLSLPTLPVPDFVSGRGSRAPPRAAVTIGARHACVRSGHAFATVFVNLPY